MPNKNSTEKSIWGIQSKMSNCQFRQTVRLHATKVRSCKRSFNVTYARRKTSLMRNWNKELTLLIHRWKTSLNERRKFVVISAMKVFSECASMMTKELMVVLGWRMRRVAQGHNNKNATLVKLIFEVRNVLFQPEGREWNWGSSLETIFHVYFQYIFCHLYMSHFG